MHMANEHKLSAASRADVGKGASRRLRRAGHIPAIIYGGDADPVNIQLAHEKTWVASQNEWFYSSIVDLDVEGTVQRVLLRDLQRHPYKQQIRHIDFQRVNENEAVRVSVPLHFLNEDTSPAGKSSEVVVMHELNEVEVSCLPRYLPEYLEIDLAALEVGDIIHLSAIKLPEGVEIPELKLGKEHDVAIVVAKHGQEEIEEPVEGEVEADADDTKAAASTDDDKDEKKDDDGK